MGENEKEKKVSTEHGVHIQLSETALQFESEPNEVFKHLSRDIAHFYWKVSTVSSEHMKFLPAPIRGITSKGLKHGNREKKNQQTSMLHK